MKLKSKKISGKFLDQHKKMRALDKLYGTTTLGARGQLVIPAQARKDLKLKPGDQLVVMGKFGKALGLMKTDQLAEFIDTIMEHVAGSGMEKEVKKHMESMFGNLSSLKK